MKCLSNGSHHQSPGSAHLIRFLSERVHKCTQEFICVVNFLRIFTYDPYQRCFRFWFIQFFEVGTQRGYDTLVGQRVLSEYVLRHSHSKPQLIRLEDRTHLHHDHCFLDDIAHASSDEIQQYVDTSLSRTLDANGGLPYRFDALPYKIDVNFRSIPVKTKFDI